MIGDNKSGNNSTKWPFIFAILVILGLGVLIAVLILLNSNNNPAPTSSSEPTTTSEVLSSSEEPSSSVDTYIDDLLTNLKNYTNNVHKSTLSISSTVKDIYSFNIYTESETTRVIYTYTTNEDSGRCFRMSVDLNADINMDQSLTIIHDNGLTLDMFDEYLQYEVVESDLVNKESFKSLYKGSYTHHLCYKDDYDTYHMSGIGIDSDKYVSIDYLTYDNTTYDIDNTDSHVEIVSTGRYYQLLNAL